METVRGLHAAVLRDERFAGALDWCLRTVFSDLVEILPLDGHAAFVAGRLRAEHSLPAGRRRANQSKAEQRAGWALDLQIAASAWTAGRAVVTLNRDDFDAIAEVIAALYPSADPLAVLDPPPLAPA